MKKILITGATGFLGGELLVELSKDERIEKIYCLIRAADNEEATKRLEKVFAFHDDYFDRNKIVAVVGDLSGEALADQLKVVTDVDTVIHSAADTSFAPNHKDNIWKVNVVGATNVAKWAAGIENLKTFVYVGTSWICGCDRPNRIVYEDESPNDKYDQLVDYTRSKTAGELKIRSIIPADKLLVVRPSVIMGDSRSWMPRSFTISWAIAAFNLLRLVAMNGKSACDLIPIDYAVNAIVELLFSNRNFTTYHISAGKSSTNMETLLNAVGIDDSDRPSFKFVDYALLKQMKSFAKSLGQQDDGLSNYSEHINYWAKTFNGNGSLRNLLWGADFYYRFTNLGLVFDNTRLLNDTGIGLSEPAHIYMGRNRAYLRKIDVIGGSLDP